jgi:hypothetical protein
MRMVMALLMLGICTGCAKHVHSPLAAVAPTLSQEKIITVVTVNLDNAKKFVSVLPRKRDEPWLPRPVKLTESAKAVGKVVFHAVITNDGIIQKLTMVQSTDPAFLWAAEAAVQSWEYQPSLNKRREAVTADATITVDFSLSK